MHVTHKVIKMMKKRIYLLALICFLLITSISRAQHHEHAENHDHNSHAHQHHLALFFGDTSRDSFDENSFTLGIDYMYFFPNSHWGISVFGEMIYADHKEFLFGFPVVYKFDSGFWMRTGIGIEFAKDEENKVEQHPLGRIGCGYDFHVKKLVLSPSIDFDGIRKHPALVIGLNVGFGF